MLPVERISYCHIARRYQPNEHRTHRVKSDDKAVNKRILDRYFRQNVEHTMYADFEHDRRQLIIRFPFVDNPSK